MKRYTEYNESGTEWLGKIPSTWNIKCLKFLADVIPSNVDKKSVDGEKAVRLCNYVDVYKNQYITNGIDFMGATASDAQITKLTLQYGDVIATKDSEDPNDIAVPALVKEDFEDVVCGYHLTLIRPNQTELLGGFLFWVLNSKGCNQFFATQAKGVTRYAVGISSFKNLAIPVPTIQEQTQIAQYLDHKTFQIDKLIADKEKLIELLNEERTAIINQAVTKGLNPDVPMKDSGIDWLGKVPEHWHLTRLKFVTKINQHSLPESTDSEYEIQYIDISGVSADGMVSETQSFRFNEAPSRARRVVKKDNIIVSTVRTYLKAIAKIEADTTNLIASTGFAVLEASSDINSDFLYNIIKSEKIIDTICSVSKGVSYPSITATDLSNIPVWTPPLPEQNAICSYIQSEENRIKRIITSSFDEIELLKEYKTALISEVVTGKVDVRDEIIAESTELVS